MSCDALAVRLPGGNVSPVFRVGDTVRRSTGPWTPAVHALLQHLESTGFAGAPRVVGIDDHHREILSYVEGTVPYADGVPAATWSDDSLAAAAQLTRAYHEATKSFVPPPDAVWRQLPGAPVRGDIVCHNDLAPWNTVFREGRPLAFIDWDFAAPAPIAWDVAYAAWRFVPLYHDGTPGLTDEPDIEDQARRLRLFCDEYGLSDRDGLLATVIRRQQVMSDTVRIWGKARVAGFAEMWLSGHAETPLRDRAFVDANQSQLSARL